MLAALRGKEEEEGLPPGPGYEALSSLRRSRRVRSRKIRTRHGEEEQRSRRRPKLKITLVKSTIGFNKNQAKVVEGMGLRRIGHTVELPDTPATRGMILKVRHLVTVER